jgi:hypothetical protein
VLPSLPGYAFSTQPAELGWHSGRVAQAWGQLMGRLGYAWYVARGGDQGAAVTDEMGRQAPPGLLGIHLSLLRTALAGAGSHPTGSDEVRAAADASHDVPDERFRLLPGAGDTAADDRLRPAGLSRRAGRVDARPRHRQLLQDLPRLPRRAARGQPHPRPHPGRHHAVLVDRQRRLRRPLVLGRRSSRRRRGTGASSGFAPGRLHHLPRRDLPGSAQLGRAGLSHAHLPPGRPGGHFAAWEEPELFAEELRAAFRFLRQHS